MKRREFFSGLIGLAAVFALPMSLKAKSKSIEERWWPLGQDEDIWLPIRPKSRVWYLQDSVWITASTAEEAQEHYLQYFELGDDDLPLYKPVLMEDEDMEEYTFFCDDGSIITFAEQLKNYERQGLTGPYLFACSDY